MVLRFETITIKLLMKNNFIQMRIGGNTERYKPSAKNKNRLLVWKQNQSNSLYCL